MWDEFSSWGAAERFGQMLRKQRLPFQIEHELIQTTTVSSSDSKYTAEGSLGNCKMCLQVPLFRFQILTVCTPQTTLIDSATQSLPRRLYHVL